MLLRADMLAGRLPFVQDAGALTRRDLAAIAGARWFLPPGLQLSDACRDLLSRLLAADPKQRLRYALCSLCPSQCARLCQGSCSGTLSSCMCG